MGRKPQEKRYRLEDGKIVISGTPEELKKKTETKNLEDAFLSLTGKEIRSDEAGTMDHLRAMRRLHHR